MTIAIDLNDVLRDYTGQFKKVYQKHIDNSFEIEDENITSSHLNEIFPFNNEEEYNKFVYIDYPYEIFGRAEAVDQMLPYRFNDWLQNTLRDVDADKIPNVMIVSPMEANLTIQASMAFLAKFPSRVREIYFPIDSSTVWDRCDILITANPLFLNNVPEDKIAIKINMPYNKDIECKYSFDKMMDIIQDKEDTIINLIEEQ